MMETGKEIFSRAMTDAYAEKYRQGLAVSASESGEFSRAHARRMSSILGSRVKYVPDKRTRIKRAVAGALIAAALLLAGCTAVTYRDKIGDFFTTVYETYIKGSFSEEEATNNEVIEEYYVPTYMPEGYELVEETLGIMATRYVLENSNGAQIIIHQAPISNIQYTIDGENGITNVLTYGQFTIYCRIIDNTGYYIWNNEKYAFSIYSDTEINEDEIIKIIDNITVKSK